MGLAVPAARTQPPVSAVWASGCGQFGLARDRNMMGRMRLMAATGGSVVCGLNEPGSPTSSDAKRKRPQRYASPNSQSINWQKAASSFLKSVRSRAGAGTGPPSTTSFLGPTRVWLGSRVAECWTQALKAWVQIAVATLSGNSLRQTAHTHCASVHQATKLVAALLRIEGLTAGLAESNGSLPPGL